MFHRRAKHVDIKRHFVPDQVDKGTLNILVCYATSYTVADLFAKGLPKGQVLKMQKLIGVVPKLF